jgi:hypothetical protein
LFSINFFRCPNCHPSCRIKPVCKKQTTVKIAFAVFELLAQLESLLWERYFDQFNGDHARAGNPARHADAFSFLASKNRLANARPHYVLFEKDFGRWAKLVSGETQAGSAGEQPAQG